MPTEKEIERGDFLNEEDFEEDNENLDEEDESEDEDNVEESEDEDEELDDLDEESEDDDDVEDEGTVEDFDVEDEEEELEDEEQRIPLSRLNQVIAQRNEEKERNKWLESQLEKLIEQGTLPGKSEEVKEPYDFVKAEAQYIDLVLEGETEKATQLRSTINEEREKLWQEKIESIKEEAQTAAETASSSKLEEEKFNTTVANFENKYSFLDVESGDYNEEAVETINELMTVYMQQGEAKSKALTKAVKKMAPFYEKTAPKEKTIDRKKAAKTKNIKASKQQPPKSRGKTTKELDLDSLDILKMSEKDFGKLTEKEKRVLRGDAI